MFVAGGGPVSSLGHRRHHPARGLPSHPALPSQLEVLLPGLQHLPRARVLRRPNQLSLPIPHGGVSLGRRDVPGIRLCRDGVPALLRRALHHALPPERGRRVRPVRVVRLPVDGGEARGRARSKPRSGSAISARTDGPSGSAGRCFGTTGTSSTGTFVAQHLGMH